MSTKKILALLLCAVMLFGAMAACAPKAPEVEDPEDVTDTTPTPEQTDTGDFDLAVCIASEPETIDPALNTSVDGAIMIHHFFEGITKWVDDGEGNAMLAPGQAELTDKTVNDDETVTYTYKMREGAKWSDGQPVTADDFVYTWQRLATPETTADYTYMIDMLKGYNEVASGEADPSTLGISAPDEMTLVIELSYDCPYFEEICAFPATFPVRQDVIESAGDQWTFDPSTYVSNGPYVLNEWVHNSYIKGVQNENYYDVETLGPDSITFQLMDDANSIYTAFQSGTLQFIDEVPTDEVGRLLASGELNIVDYVGTYYACFQVEKAPFDDARVREAFSLVIDRNYIVEKVKQTGELPATGFVPSGVYDAEGVEGDDFRTVGGDYYSVDADDYEANCERARELLAEAGYPGGEGFPAVEYLYNTNDDHKAIGEALQEMWKNQLGVDVTLNNQEWAVFLQTRKDGDYQIARNGWIADYNDPISFLDMWYTDGGNNDAQYSRAEYDAAIDAAKATADPAERMKQMHIAEDLIIGEDHALAPIYFYTQRYMLADDIEGMYHTPLGYFFFMHTSKAA